jgi:arylsulfatase A-like enzyme
MLHGEGEEMRILYIDIDSLRPDHLGCYGYHRRTSSNIDGIASEGVRFERCHCSDSPCLPSRTALFSGRFGIHTGVVANGGTAADHFVEGPRRGFTSTLGKSSWMYALRKAGLKTVTVSSFGERHSAWPWYANFSEVYNTGRLGMERSDEVAPTAIDWIRRRGAEDNWFLHVNLWDTHTPYQTPLELGEPFEDEPAPAWLTEDVRARHWAGVGPQSAQERGGLDGVDAYRGRYPRQPDFMRSMEEVRRMFDGYDTALLYADQHVGRILSALDEQGVLEETAVMVSSDHGECLGELNVYGCHQTADEIVTRVPLILRWPGIPGGRVDSALHYQFDLAATVIELAGGEVPQNWDGASFAAALREGREEGRGFLVVGHGQGSYQRAVRFDDYICIRTYHDGYHGFPGIMLFDVKNDPHEETDLAASRPEVVARAMRLLEDWHADAMRTATHPLDPFWTLMAEGPPPHVRGQLGRYLERLRATGRAEWAERLAERHPVECV